MNEDDVAYYNQNTLPVLRNTEAQVFHSVCWMPTLRCPLRCSYCAARSLPIDKHGQWADELSPAEWVRVWDECPRPIEQVAITGGEPSFYDGLGEVLRHTDWRFTIDTNLFRTVSTWLEDVDPARIIAVNAGFHFALENERAEAYWRHLEEAREILPATTQVVCCQVVSQREAPDEVERTRLWAESIGVEYRPLTFDDTFLYRHRFPIMQDVRAEACAQGSWYLTVLPDSAAYRCTGHTYFDVGCLGKLATNGWNIASPKAQACEAILCTVCDPGRPPWVNRYAMRESVQAEGD